MNFYVCHTYVGPVEARRRYQIPGAEVTDDCELTDMGDARAASAFITESFLEPQDSLI